MKSLFLVALALMLTMSTSSPLFAADADNVQQKFEKATSGFDLTKALQSAESSLKKTNADLAVETLDHAVKALNSGDNLAAVNLLDACETYCTLGDLTPPANLKDLQKVAAMKLAKQRMKEAFENFQAKKYDAAFDSIDRARHNMRNLKKFNEPPKKN